MMMKINEMVTVDTSPVEHDDGDDNEMMTVDTSPVQRLQLSSVALSSKAILSKMCELFLSCLHKKRSSGDIFFFFTSNFDKGLLCRSTGKLKQTFLIFPENRTFKYVNVDSSIFPGGLLPL